MNAVTTLGSNQSIVHRETQAVVSARGDSLSPWSMPRVAGIILLTAAGVFAVRGAWTDIYYAAMLDEEASHIWLVPFLVGWLIWIRRASLQKVEPTNSFIGPLLIAAGWALAHWGYNAPRQSPFHLGAVLVLLGCVWTFVGSRFMRAIWPAVLVLVFLVPVPAMARQRISLPLEQITAAITTHILQWFHLPVTRAVNEISINNVPVTIAEACNGLRMLFPLFLIVYVFCFTVPLRPWVRWFLILTSPISAVACNVLRLLPTTLLYGYSSKTAAQRFHDWSGWAMVPVAFIALMFVVKLMGAVGIAVLQKEKA